MRYAEIKKYDVANGVGVRTSIFVTGCTHNCFNCFNKELQNFSYGDIWTNEETQKVIDYLQLPQVAGLSLLGGEPMQNAKSLTMVLTDIKQHTNKSIWCWSGFTLEQILLNKNMTELLKKIDVLVDGKFEEDKKDLTLKFKGSSNQRVINVKETLKQNEIILYE